MLLFHRNHLLHVPRRRVGRLDDVEGGSPAAADLSHFHGDAGDVSGRWLKWSAWHALKDVAVGNTCTWLRTFQLAADRPGDKCSAHFNEWINTAAQISNVAVKLMTSQSIGRWAARFRKSKKTLWAISRPTPTVRDTTQRAISTHVDGRECCTRD